ncbi:MAG: flagellar biosynthetic protein FliO [Alphaproteobacteria bacterium]|nr:flagellar biosynthetic protein FliO [Alphaproteobacteria bacterium]
MDFSTYFQFLLALIFVLALIGLIAWAYRHFALGGKVLGGARKTGRLEVIESKHVDAKRRLVLLRRDSVEHLILLGPNGETVVETGIASAGEGRRPGAPTESDR